MHCIFGYGSLICAKSRARTGHTGQAVSVIVDGLTRSWGCNEKWNEDGTGATFLSAVSVGSTETACNGVVVEVASDDMSSFDEVFVAADVSRSHLHVCVCAAVEGRGVHPYRS